MSIRTMLRLCTTLAVALLVTNVALLLLAVVTGDYDTTKVVFNLAFAALSAFALTQLRDLRHRVHGPPRDTPMRRGVGG